MSAWCKDRCTHQQRGDAAVGFLQHARNLAINAPLGVGRRAQRPVRVLTAAQIISKAVSLGIDTGFAWCPRGHCQTTACLVMCLMLPAHSHGIAYTHGGSRFMARFGQAPEKAPSSRRMSCEGRPVVGGRRAGGVTFRPGLWPGL